MKISRFFVRLSHSLIFRCAIVLLVILFSLYSKNYLLYNGVLFWVLLAWIGFIWYSTDHAIAEIHDAARKGDLAKVKELLKDDPKLIASKDDRFYYVKEDNGRTPLHNAAANNRKDVVEFLLAEGAEVTH